MLLTEPASHGEQDAAAGRLENLPVSHATHEVAPLGANEPTGHC